MIIGIIIKYEKRLRKEGNMLGLPINNNQAKSLPLQREIWRVALPWVRSIQPQGLGASKKKQKKNYIILQGVVRDSSVV